MKKALLACCLCVVLVPALAGNVSARKRLLSVDEWGRVCASLAAPGAAALCQARLHRAVASGRSLGAFDLIVPERSDLLQSRSGVFFSKELNGIITALREDSGLRTTMVLHDSARCQSYAAAPDLVGVPRSGARYARLVHDWLREYTDARFDIHQMESGEHNGMRSLAFAAKTSEGGVIRGLYVFDEQANAGIFSTCDRPAALPEADRDVEQFFRSIVGSARRFT